MNIILILNEHKLLKINTTADPNLTKLNFKMLKGISSVKTDRSMYWPHIFHSLLVSFLYLDPSCIACTGSLRGLAFLF